MAIKWQGSIVNRLMEASKEPEIVVGMGVTECSWSDRHPYEVIAVKDQKHITIRPLGHRPAKNFTPYSNDWELYSDENAIPMDIVKRGKYWYSVATYTDTTDGKEHKKYYRQHLCFGRAEYYYDYSF